MKEKIRPIARRLTRRIVVPMFIIMLLISSVVSIFAAAGMLVLIEEHFADMQELANAKVATMLRSVEISAVNNVDEVQFYLANPATMKKSLASELELNSHLTGCGVGFVPNYYPKKGKWYEVYARNNNGVVEVEEIGSAKHDYFESEWYKEGVSAQNGYWSNPYFDDAGAHTVLCTYALPVKDKKGNTVGVFAADLSLDWLMEQLHQWDLQEQEHGFSDKQDPSKASYSFILGRGGEYIVHPDKSRIMQSNFFDYADSTDRKCRELGEKMLSGQTGRLNATLDGIPSYVFFAPLEKTGWSIGIVVPVSTATGFGLTTAGIMLSLILIGVLIVALLCYYTIKRTTLPLRKLAQSADEVSKGNFDTQLPVIRHKDEVYLLRNSFDNMQHSLTRYIDQLTDTTARNASMESELSIARGIQMSMLPKTFPPFPERKDVDVFAQLTPAKAVGGDLYDFYIREGRLFFCIGDVSGKGVPASLVMAVTNAQFRTLSASENSPANIVGEINRMMASRNSSMMFVTFFVGALDLSTGVLQYCNAGHNAPVLLDGEVKALKVDSNIPLGVDASWNYSLQEITLEPGSTIFLYTDGLTEAEDKKQDLFGENRVFSALRKAPADTPKDLIKNMSLSVEEFVGEAVQSDDLTMLAIRYNKA